MAATYTATNWTITIEITTPTSTANVANCVTAGGYLLRANLALTANPTSSTNMASGKITVSYVIIETVPTAGSLTNLGSLFTLFGYTVL